MADERLIDRENLEEHYVRKGDPSKPTYYIIRRNGPLNGLFEFYKMIAGHIAYSLKRGWLPVVDMQNYPNIYLPPEKLGKENAWEYYFEQPLRIGLEQAYSGENIVLSTGSSNIIHPNVLMAFYENKNDILTKWRMLVELGLLKVKPALMKEITTMRKKLFSPKDRVLGVSIRGTDYVANRPDGHAIPPL